MNPIRSEERPLGVYLIALYFFLTAFLESIQKFRQWGSPVVLNPFSEHSVWQLVANTIGYLLVAYLVWQRTWFGRLAALVFGYLTLATYLASFLLYLSQPELNFTRLFAVLALYHVVTLVPLLIYLQPARRKTLFPVSLLEILLPHD